MEKSVYSDQYKAFVALLVAARKQTGLTQQKLADRLGRPQSFVAKYEGCERRLDVVEFLAIARLLDLDPHEVIRRLDT